MNIPKDHIFLVDHGALLNQNDREFNCYNCVYDKQYGYYDVEQYYTTDPEKDLKAIKKLYTDENTDDYYIIITDQGHIDDYGDTFQTNNIDEIPLDTVNTDYSVPAIIYYEGKCNGKPITIQNCKVKNGLTS